MRQSRLKKIIFIFLTALSFFAFSATQAFCYEVNKAAISLLISKDGSGKKISSGTGFVVKPEGILITNYHVLVDAASVDAIFPNGRKATVTGILKVDRTRDFAILKLKDGFYSTLELGNSDTINNYDFSSALGFFSTNAELVNGNLNDILIQTYGFVLGVLPQANPDFSYIYSTTPLRPGFSGGPLIDKNNKVFGIAAVEGPAINLALPINEIKPFLNASPPFTFSELRERDRGAKEALYYKGNFALYGQGDIETAIEFFQKALKKDPKYVPALFDLAAAKRNMGLLEDSTRYYEKAIEIHPNFPEALSNLGGYYFRAGKLEKAEEIFSHAVKVFPNFLQALSNLGATLHKLKRNEEAISYLKKSLLLDPQFAIAYFNLGNSYFELGKLEEAETAFKQSVDLGVDFLSLHWKLYEIYKKRGEKEKAGNQLRIILQIEPGNEEALRKLSRIDPQKK